MKICFIGLGSIGSRHIKNISTILEERNIEYCIDVLRSTKTALPEDITPLLALEYYDINELPIDYDIIFITNPTNMHYDMIRRIAHKTKHIFIEKPIFESNKYDLINLKLKNGIYYVACPLRYTPVIKFIKNIINDEKIYSARAISSSYLPDWRKDSDYRKIYSAKKSQGGGVSLDLIHEWDYLTYLFGFPIQLYNFNGKYSNLEIDSDDISIYIAKYKDKLVELHLDYFGRNTTRQLEIFCEDYVIYADLIQNIISYNGTIQKSISLEREDMYLNEMNHFLDMILNNVNNNNDIYHAYKVLSIATGDQYIN